MTGILFAQTRSSKKKVRDRIASSLSWVNKKNGTDEIKAPCFLSLKWSEKGNEMKEKSSRVSEVFKCARLFDEKLRFEVFVIKL